MTHSKTIILTGLCIVLAGCSDYDGREVHVVAAPIPPMTIVPPPMEPVDVSGTWFGRIETNAVNCNAGEFIDGNSVIISQNKTDISLHMSSGDLFTGTVNGDIVEWVGSYPVRGGTSEFTSASVVFSEDSGAGNTAWTWTDGVDSCNGTMAVGFRRTAMVESASNSRPQIADQFDFVDDVAYFTGSLGEGIDTTDYFSFTATRDALLQVELSHFDISVTNLDLSVLNENVQEIGRSDSVSEFEMVEVPLVAGDRYYIRVSGTSLSGVDTYHLSLDIN